MNIFSKKICVILPHLDDEFAIAPLIKKLVKFNDFKVIFCTERRQTPLINQNRRRKESESSLNYLGIKYKDIFYLNDHFLVDDMTIHLSKAIIYDYLSKMNNFFKFDIIFTLNLEGGHPDHDSLSLLVNKFSEKEKIKAYYFPAYNSRRNLIIFPFSILRPLQSQEYFFQKEIIKPFCWMDSVIVAFNYVSEWKAMIKIIPFIILKILTSNFIFFTEKIEFESINWDKSLTCSRYKVAPDLILFK